MSMMVGRVIMQAVTWVVAGIGILCGVMLALVVVSMLLGVKADGIVVPMLAALTALLLGLAWLMHRTSTKPDRVAAAAERAAAVDPSSDRGE